jgi:hypothetical protein
MYVVSVTGDSKRVVMLNVDAVWNFGGSSSNIEPVSQFSAPLANYLLAECTLTSNCTLA